MIDEATAKNELRRLTGLRPLPETKEAAHECALSLMNATDAEEAKQVVSDLLRECRMFPSPAEIRAAVMSQHNSEEWRSPEPTGCTCRGLMFVPSRRYTGYRMCVCHPGRTTQALRQGDQR
jgi:hypothetical protein